MYEYINEKKVGICNEKWLDYQYVGAKYSHSKTSCHMTLKYYAAEN